MNLKLEKNIPISPKGAAKWKALFKSASKGDSLVLNEREERSLRTTAYALGKKIVRRKLNKPDEIGNPRYRVWLI